MKFHFHMNRVNLFNFSLPSSKVNLDCLKKVCDNNSKKGFLFLIVVIYSANFTTLYICYQFSFRFFLYMCPSLFNKTLNLKLFLFLLFCFFFSFIYKNFYILVSTCLNQWFQGGKESNLDPIMNKNFKRCIVSLLLLFRSMIIIRYGLLINSFFFW